MNNSFTLFVLLSVLITGIMVFPSSFADDHVNGTANNGTSTNSTSTEENVVVDDEMEFEMTGDEEMTDDEELLDNEQVMEDEEETMEDVVPSILSPLKQIKEGIAPENIVCKEGLELIFKISGQPACIQATSVEKLIAWGWAQ
ncbi:hypothetical protein [Nitrosarchaeum sp.]|uniref:hypothetical protein n=1 Tax=Nitrosarchaeum sp. TaxID=2026886 RepID=UPI00247E134D|nr:hypothetical protein [Nitrosarchaeum sp.]MCV0411749.1 hypothetical protein [Nitrosarchaeum sp.]